MSIIWFILKLILYVLLGILGIAILLVALLLLLPIEYEGKLSYDTALWVRAQVRVFYVLKLQIGYDEEDLSTKITLFGRECFKEVEVSEVPDEKPYSEQGTCKAQKVQSTPLNRVEEEQVQHPQADISEKVPRSTDEIKDPPPKHKSSKKSLTQTQAPKKIGTTIKETWDMVCTLWTDEHRKAFFSAIGKLLKSLWHAIRPKYCSFYLKIGKESPDETGQLLAWLACLFPFYAGYGRVVGDFEKAGIAGEGELAGKFNLWRLIRPLIVLVLNRSVREYIHLILHIRKDEKHGIKTQQ